MENLTFDQTKKELAHLGRLSVALEAQIQLHYTLDDISDDVKNIMRVTLENIDPQIDIKEGSAITLRALKEGVKKAAKYAADFIKYLYNLLKSVWVKFTGSLSSVRSRHTRINKRLAAMGNVTPYKKLNVTNIQRLSINGEFVGTDPDKLKDILATTDYLLHDYPKCVVNITRDVSRACLNINSPSKDQKQLLSEISAQFGDIYQKEFKEPASVAVGNEFSSEIKGIHRTKVLPDNVALVFVPKDAIKEAIKPNDSFPTVIRRSLVMKFTELQMAVADSGEKEIDPPSIKNLNALMNLISEILDSAQKGNAYLKDYETAKTVVDDAIRQIAQRNEDSNIASNALIYVLGELSEKLIEPATYYTHWLAITLNVYLSFIDFCLNNYQEKAA